MSEYPRNAPSDNPEKITKVIRYKASKEKT